MLIVSGDVEAVISKMTRKGRRMTEYFRIDDERVQAIAADANMTPEAVREYCTADWPEGQEHQDWLDTASVHEIATWCWQGDQTQH